MRTLRKISIVAIVLSAGFLFIASRPQRSGDENHRNKREHRGLPTMIAAHSSVVKNQNESEDSTATKKPQMLDGDKLFKENCSRCHQSPGDFPPAQTATIMRHMRVRANLTADETKAIYEFLTQ